MDSKQTGETQDTVQRDRKERGEVRDAHLDAAREQAQKANAQARERNQARSKSSDDHADAAGHARRRTKKSNDEAAVKAQARARYEGTDEAFEEDWPTIRERLMNEDMQKGVERIRRRL
jgi:hypothetical protein